MSNEKRILILGAGVMQIPAITAARKKGWWVTVADGNPNAVGICKADAFRLVDLKDEEGMLACASELMRTEGLDGVFTAGTDFSTTVAYVTEKLGLPGIPYVVARNATDKARMRSVFEKNGIPSTRFIEYGENDDMDSVTEALGFPMVIKPVDSMGARGIRKVENEEELRPALEEAHRHSRCGRIIAEEYIEGPEYSLDAVIHEGDITVCGVADRHICFHPYFVEMGHTMPTGADRTIVSALKEVFKNAVRSLGITEGAAKGDLFMGKKGPVVGEIAARLSGGYMSGWTYPYSSGLDLTGAALSIAVGLSHGDLSPVHNRYSAERAFISIPGTIASIHGRENARMLPDIRDVFSTKDIGDRVTFPTNNVQKCGNCISAAGSREEAVAAAERAAETIVIRLLPGDDSTAGFLFGEGYEWVPDAFTLADGENLSTLSSMSMMRNRTNTDRNDTVTICGLPNQDKETAIDWQGRSFRKSLELIETCGHVRFQSTDRPYDLGSVFWMAFLRGGLQGGLWIVDTIRGMRKNGYGNKLRSIETLVAAR